MYMRTYSDLNMVRHKWPRHIAPTLYINFSKSLFSVSTYFGKQISSHNKKKTYLARQLFMTKRPAYLTSVTSTSRQWRSEINNRELHNKIKPQPLAKTVIDNYTNIINMDGHSKVADTTGAVQPGIRRRTP